MARPAKLTKYSIENALANSRSVTGAAAYAGVNRRTFQRAMRRFGIFFAAASDRFTGLLEPVAATPTQGTDPVEIPTKPVEPKHRPDRDILKLSVNDFTGPYRGDAGRGSFAARADEQPARYHKLKGF